MKKFWRESVKPFWIRYHEKILYGLTLVTVILALIGSYQYYTDIRYTPEGVPSDRLWTSVFYSTMKLYLFSPTAGAGVATPDCYEIAKWLAPLCTAFWIFRSLESLLRHYFGRVKRNGNKNSQVIVFGHNPESIQFITDLCKCNERAVLEKQKEHLIVLVADTSLKDEEKLKLERKGILVYDMNLLDSNEKRRKDYWKTLQIYKADFLVFFHQDAVKNFSIFMKLIEFLTTDAQSGRGKSADKWKKEAVLCSIQCNDYTIREVIDKYYKDQKEDSVGKQVTEKMILQLFSIPELAATQLFMQHPIYETPLNNAYLKKIAVEDRKLQDIENPHLAIIGFGTFGQAVFEKALLIGNLNVQVKERDKLRITVFDNEASKKKHMVYAKYPRLDTICHIKFVNIDIQSDRFGKYLGQSYEGDHPITYAVICFGNQTLSMLSMMELAKYSKGHENVCSYDGQGNQCQSGNCSSCGNSHCLKVTIATRMEEDGSAVDYIKKDQDIYAFAVPFAVRKSLLTKDMIMNAKMEKEAKLFHENYCEATNSKCIPWNVLPLKKLESNRIQVQFRPYIEAIQEYLGGVTTLEGYLDMKCDVLIERLKENERLNDLVALEHRRWSNFMYVQGYIGRANSAQRIVKNGDYCKVDNEGTIYYGQVHSCLIDEWDQLLEDEAVSGTVKYDLCSIYQYIRRKKGHE